MRKHSASLPWPRSVGPRINQQLPDMATIYVSLLLLCYPFTKLIPGIRLAEIIYFDSFRIAILAGLYFLLIIFQQGRPNTCISFNRLDRLLFIFFISLTVSIIWSVDKGTTLRQLNYIFFACLFYILCLSLLRHEYSLYKLNSCLLCLPFLYCAGAYLVYIKYDTLRPSLSALGEDLSTLGTFPDFIGAATEITLPFLFVLIILPRNKNQLILAWLSLLSLVSTIIMSESRGSLIAVVFMTFLFFFMYLKRLRRITIRNASIFMVIGLTIALLLFSPVLEKSKENIFNRFDKAFELDESKEVRVALYLMDIQMIRDNILLGYGYGTHSKVASDNFNQHYKDEGIGSHNVIVDIWQGAGIFSIIIFLCLIYKTLKNLRQKMWLPTLKQRQWLFILAVYVAISGSLLHALFRPLLDNPNFYLMLAISSVIFKSFNKQGS